MKCPFCGNPDSKVIDSRSADNGQVIRRRRECKGCKKRFTTFERFEQFPPADVRQLPGGKLEDYGSVGVDLLEEGERTDGDVSAQPGAGMGGEQAVVDGRCRG